MGDRLYVGKREMKRRTSSLKNLIPKLAEFVLLLRNSNELKIVIAVELF